MSWDFGDSLGPWSQGGDDEDAAATDEVDAVDEQPIRKGGGPPGRSAFLPGGRLRRLSRDRAHVAEREPVAEPAMSAFRPASDEAAFRPVGDWIADPMPRSEPDTIHEPAAPGADHGTWDPFADQSFGDPGVDDTTQTHESAGAAGTNAATDPGASARLRSFPGGRAKLPRLTPTTEGTEYDYVSTAFIPGHDTGETDDHGARTGFHGYNTYESLFENETIADPLTKPVDDDAYSVLGVQPDDDWKVVVRAHRQLVKANHPDHLLDAPAAERHAAEERLRQINLAYREVKEDRRVAGESTSSPLSEEDGAPGDVASDDESRTDPDN